MHRVRSIAALVAALVVLSVPAARAEEHDGAPDPVKVRSFDQRLFATANGGSGSAACFVRRYDAGHLARHPQQKVSAMRVLISAEKAPEDAGNSYSFHLGLNYRAHKALYVSAGSCRHSRAEIGSDEVQFGCGVDCDGGGFALALADDGRSIVISLERLRIWQKGKVDSDSTPDLEAGADDKSFRLERVELRQCDGVVERSQVAAVGRN